MNKFDKEVRRLAKQTKCITSKEYEERMDFLLKKLHREDRNKVRKSIFTFSAGKAGFAACILIAAVVVAVPTTAKVNNMVAERMASMSEKEQKVYVGMMDPDKRTREHDTEAIRYSRTLSSDEEMRMNYLSGQYEEGVFPEGGMKIVDRLEENTEITCPVLEIWNREFYLPERELTDNELLQMIDVMQKERYTAENSEESKKTIAEQQEFIENPNPGEKDITEEEAVAKASAYLQGMYGIDVSSMNYTVEFVMGHYLDDGGYGDYEVIFQGNDDWSYVIDLKGETGVPTDIMILKGDLNYANYVSGQSWEVTENGINSAYESTKEKLFEMFGSDIEIVRSTCEFPIDEDENVTEGALYFLFESDNGYTYHFRYMIDEDMIGYFLISENDSLSLHISRNGYVVMPLEP
ncbi:MAG: hypothetical protein HDT39_04560 [Lachnospiraceae bacterium]|nr:hypothetical protein [Lachnospiraceae bacterium]